MSKQSTDSLFPVRASQQRKDKDEAMELMNAARQHHDHAFKHGDRYGSSHLLGLTTSTDICLSCSSLRSSLYQALTIYKQAYSLLPTNAGLKKRCVYFCIGAAPSHRDLA